MHADGIGQLWAACALDRGRGQEKCVSLSECGGWTPLFKHVQEK